MFLLNCIIVSTLLHNKKKITKQNVVYFVSIKFSSFVCVFGYTVFIEVMSQELVGPTNLLGEKFSLSISNLQVSS